MGSRLNRPRKKTHLTTPPNSPGQVGHSGHGRHGLVALVHSKSNASEAGEMRQSDRRRLWTALLLTAAIAVAEVAGGFLTNSLSLISDAGHMLTDVSALGVTLVARSLAA